MQRRLVMFALEALVPMALLAAGLAYFTLYQQQDETRDRALSRAREIMREVDRELQSNLKMLEILANSPLFDEPEPDLAHFRVLASRWLEQLPLWSRIILADRAERQVINTGAPIGAALPQVVDLDGFRRVVETKGAVIGDVVGPGPLRKDGLPRASFRAPVIHDGAVTYVLTATASIDGFADLLLNNSLPPGWRPLPC